MSQEVKYIKKAEDAILKTKERFMIEYGMVLSLRVILRGLIRTPKKPIPLLGYFLDVSHASPSIPKARTEWRCMIVHLFFF